MHLPLTTLAAHGRTPANPSLCGGGGQCERLGIIPGARALMKRGMPPSQRSPSQPHPSRRGASSTSICKGFPQQMQHRDCLCYCTDNPPRSVAPTSCGILRDFHISFSALALPADRCRRIIHHAYNVMPGGGPRWPTTPHRITGRGQQIRSIDKERGWLGGVGWSSRPGEGRMAGLIIIWHSGGGPVRHSTVSVAPAKAGTERRHIK